MRYQGLRRISRIRRKPPKLDDDTDDDSDDNDNDNNNENDVNMKLLGPVSDYEKTKYLELERLFILTPFIQRDAYERYLLIHHFVKQISDQWSLFLFCCIFCSLGATALTYYFLYKSKQIIWQYIFALVLEALFVIYPVACLAYANKHVENILLNFKFSSPDDYQILGSRDKWTDFTTKSPLYWTIIGIPITKNVLTAYASAASATLPVIIAMVAGVLKEFTK